MRTLVICRANLKQGSGGFSLIEIVVVLFLFSLLSGIVAPRVASMYDSYKNKTQLDQIITTIQNVSQHAYIRGESVFLHDYLEAQGVVPDGWRIRWEKPVVIKSNGACLGGEIDILASTRLFRFLVIPPFCQLEALDEAGG